MATSTSRYAKSGRNPQHNAIKSSRKTRTTRQQTSKTSATRRRLATSDDESEDADCDAAAAEEHTESTDDPAAVSLPSVKQRRGGAETASRSAGYNEDDDTFQDIMDDDMQAAGAALSDSEDDDYADVEDVSDSDGDDEEEVDESNVLKSAEKDLIDEFERTEHRRSANSMIDELNDMALVEDELLARRLSLQASESLEELSFPIDMNEDPFFGLQGNDSLYLDMQEEAELAIWRMPDMIRDRENSDPINGTQKRVRFEETRSRESSVSGSDDAEVEEFPDLFAAQDDPMLKQRLALAVHQDASLRQSEAGDAESCYDFEDEDEKLAFELDNESDSDDDLSSSDSSENGDTTDDESYEEQMARLEAVKKARRSPSQITTTTPLPRKRATSRANVTPSTPSRLTPKTGRGPQAGTFADDPTRATMTSDVGGKKIKLLPPSDPLEKDKDFWHRARTAANSRDGSPNTEMYLTMRSPGSDNLPRRPFTAQSTLGSMFNGNLDVLQNNDVPGLTDDFLPSIVTTPHHTSFSATTATEDSDDDEYHDINMQDFIDINDSSSDSDGPNSASQAFHTPTAPGPGLLGHFDHTRGLVGSFRRNQYQAKHFSSLPSHPAKRASTHEFNALQKGRRGAANTPMTPARKKRVSQDLSSTPIGLMNSGVRKPIASPLSASRRPRSRGNSIHQAGLLQTLGRDVFE